MAPRVTCSMALPLLMMLLVGSAVARPAATGDKDTSVPLTAAAVQARFFDLVLVKKSVTGTKSTEVHILAAPTYQKYSLHTGSALHETDGTFAFVMAPNRDIVAIKKSKTGTKSTEVHILAAPTYKKFSLQTGTALHETDDTFDFVMAPNRDIVAIKKSKTGTKSTEVHILAAPFYQKFSLHTGTPLHETDGTFDFLMAPNRDLVVIKKSNTGTKSTEVHVLAAPTYQRYSLHTGTALHETDDTFAFAITPNRDIMAIKKSKTGTKSTEVHVLAAPTYQTFSLHTGTALHETDGTFEFFA